MKSNTPLVSVIIPIYNVEKYLEECLDSVVNQTYKNLEIILIDDKSPDSSGKIADQYAKKDKRIKVIHKPRNEGPYAARLTGFKSMGGEYFTVIDSDDYVSEDYIEVFIEEALDSRADIVSTRGFIITHSDETKNYPVLFSDKTIKNLGMKYSDYLMELAQNPDDYHWSMCGRLFKNSVYEKTKKYLAKVTDHLVMAEDMLMFSVLAFLVESSTATNRFSYHYRMREGSSMNTVDSNMLEKQFADVKLVMQYLKSFIKQVGIYEECKEYYQKFEDFMLGSHENRVSSTKSPLPRKVVLTGKKKILCPTPFGSFRGGGERSSYVLWRWLNQYFDIIIVLPKDTEGEYFQACEKDGISYVCGDYPHMSTDNIPTTEIITDLIKEFNPDIVFPTLYFAPAFWAASITDTPCVYLDYGLIRMVLDPTIGSRGGMEFAASMLKSANLIIVNSLIGQDTALQFGRSSTLVWSYTEKPKMKFSMHKDVNFVYPARIEHDKRQLDLARATRILRDRGVKVGVKIVGTYEERFEGHKEYYDEVVDYIKQNSLEDVITMTGWMDNPWNEFGVNDIYVTTTATESVGRATLEAVQLGIPVLIPDIPGHREFRDVIGLSAKNFYAPGNVDDLAQKAEFLIRNIESAKKRAKTYQAKALSAFSEEKCNENVLSALNSIIGESNPGAADFNQDSFMKMSKYQQEVEDLTRERARLMTELAGHLSIKRSAKLTAGNIRRRLRHGKNRGRS